MDADIGRGGAWRGLAGDRVGGVERVADAVAVTVDALAALGVTVFLKESRARADPALEHLRASLGKPIAVPTLALCGADDLRAGPMSGQAAHFAGEYAYVEVPAAGHFLHREQPAAVTALILDWFGRG